jgi:hypothetical protein
VIARWLIRLLVRVLSAPRVIYDRNGVSPYLSRYYIIGAPKMPDGYAPFDSFGSPQDGVIWGDKRWGLYLHRFHRGDDERELHNHPWRWALSLIIAGGYVEERRGADDVVRTRVVKPWRLNFIRANDFHRVDLVGEDAWTLFLVGHKFQDWGFWSRDTGEFWPWRVFINRLRDPAAFDREEVAE